MDVLVEASKPFTSSFIFFFFFVTDGLLYWSSELRLYFAIITSVRFDLLNGLY